MSNRSEKKARPGLTLVAVGLLSAVVAFVGVVQVRSQAEVVRTLEGQDNASLAFLIDDLHRANDALAAQSADLAARRDRLATNDSSQIDPALRDEAQRLRMIEGLVPVHGRGIVLAIDAPLTRLDLEDAVDSLRASGAEAIAINEHRLVTGTAIRQDGGTVLIDSTPVQGPWTIAVIGDLDRLTATADVLTRSLRANDRVRSATYRADPDLQIRATLPDRPFVYGTT
jgi:uncharacterized protein YlxW (UPF0749 family)